MGKSWEGLGERGGCKEIYWVRKCTERLSYEGPNFVASRSAIFFKLERRREVIMLTSVLNLWEATVWLLKQRFDGIGNEILNTCPLSSICDAHALPAVTNLPLRLFPDTVICFGYAITRVTKDSYIFVVTNIDSRALFLKRSHRCSNCN